MDMSEEEVNEIAKLIKEESDKKKVEEAKVNQGFTIICNHCKNELVVSRASGYKNDHMSVEPHTMEGERIRLECKCGNKVTSQNFVDYTV